jgi:hypothetical protein
MSRAKVRFDLRSLPPAEQEPGRRFRTIDDVRLAIDGHKKDTSPAVAARRRQVTASVVVVTLAAIEERGADYGPRNHPLQVYRRTASPLPGKLSTAGAAVRRSLSDQYVVGNVLRANRNFAECVKLRRNAP